MNNLPNSNSWYEAPENIIGIPLNAITGKYDENSKNSNIFYFVKGTEPITQEITVSKNSDN